MVKILSVILVLITQFVCGVCQDEVLLVVHDREITKEEFLYYLHKNKQPLNKATIKDFLDLFIDFQLKVVQATEERLYGNIAFITELTEFRKQLAGPYLTDREKEEEFVKEAMERLKYELKVSHILIRLALDGSPADTLKAYKKALQIRDRLAGGESFAHLAITVSDDPLAVKDSGNLGYITAFDTEYPFETAVFSMTVGDISIPVRTHSGYHIIKLIDRRKSSGITKDEQEIRQLIFKAKDKRSEIIQDAFVEKMKIYWDFSENRKALENIYNLADESVFKGNWFPPANKVLNDTIFFIDHKGLTQQDFIEYISDFENENTEISIKEFISSLYQQFVASSLIKYENYKLEDKYPEFHFQLQEYRDAMLLEAITRQKILLKAESDKAGIEKFYNENSKKYMQAERMDAVICSTTDKKEAERGVKLMEKKFSNDDQSVDQLLSQINKRNNEFHLSATKGTFSRGDNQLIDKITWQKGISDIYKVNGEFQFVVVCSILQPEARNLEEVYNTVFDDYKNYLMNNWIGELHNKYRVEINQKVLSTIM